MVKKTIWYSNVFFYEHLYRNSVFRNIIMESGIILHLPGQSKIAIIAVVINVPFARFDNRPKYNV